MIGVKMAIEMARTADRSYSIAQARDRLAAAVRDAERGIAVEITRRGRPVAALVSIGDFRRLRSGSGGFWAACERFRSTLHVAELGIGPRVFRGVRDRSTGREPAW